MKTASTFTTLALAALAASSQTIEWSVAPRGVALATDAAENVYTVDAELAPAGDITLTKTSPAGVTLFAARHDNTDPARADAATWVETDSTGGAYVSGTSLGGFPNAQPANGLLMRFAPDGTLRWRAVLGTDADGGSTYRVLVDAADNAYVLGMGPTVAGVRMRIHKVAPDGTATLWWVDRLGIGAPTGFKWGLNGDLVVAGGDAARQQGGVLRIGPDGRTRQAVTAVPAFGGQVDGAADAAGNLYVASTDPASAQGRLARHPAGFGQPWTHVDPVALRFVEVAPDGAAVAAGAAAFNQPGVAVVKFTSGGTLDWANRDADGPQSEFSELARLRLDAAGNAFLAAQGLLRVEASGRSGWVLTGPFASAKGLAFGALTGAVYTVGASTARISQERPVPTGPDLEITMTDSPDPARPNAPITLTTTVRNRGQAPAPGILLRQNQSVVPVTVLSVNASQGSCTTAGPLVCQLGTLAPGASLTVTEVISVSGITGFATTAIVSTDAPEQDVGNNTITISTAVRRR